MRRRDRQTAYSRVVLALFLSVLMICGFAINPSGALAGLDSAGGQSVAPPPKDIALRKTGLDPLDGISPMGRLAQQALLRAAGLAPNSGIDCSNGQDCGEGPAGGQAETSIAVDPTGQHIVIGYNDTRGFALNPVSLSGFFYSDDGGATFTDGGQLPIASNGQIGTTLLPEVFGDPDVMFVPGGTGCQFIYASIGVVGYTGSAPNFNGSAQTMVIHRSTDCGHTWAGPFEITAATNPTGVNVGFNARDVADKEFIDVNPDTKRVLVSWSNFTSLAVIPGGVQISTAYCDNIMAGNPPTWSTRSVLNPGSTTFDTGSMPRFAGNGSTNAYVTWSSSSTTAFSNNVVAARSTNSAVSWSSGANLAAADFLSMDYVLGNDRVHNFPAIAVDNSGGARAGSIYVVAADNANHDGADIAFWRSTNGGASFSATAFLNSRPGNDRAQWFPAVTVDQNTSRVYVFYLDQGIATSGDLTEITYTYSDDGGATWHKPAPLTQRPFHAGHGNDTGQPNLGDYNRIVALNGELFAAWGGTSQPGYTNGQPNASFTTPDVFFRRLAATTVMPSLRLGKVTLVDSGGNGTIDQTERVTLTIPLENYVTNTLNAASVNGINALLSSDTPGVTVVQGRSTYPTIPAGGSAASVTPFVLNFAPNFVPGTTTGLKMTITSTQGSITLVYSQTTGTPVSTTLFAENFNGVSPSTLPAGWGTIHQGGANTVAWTTNSTFCSSTSNALYHQEANDNGAGDPTRFERAASPNIVIPANVDYVTLDFDICYDLEDEPAFNVLAYDGATLRITDLTSGHFARAVLAEAFAERITTGDFFHFPKHTPRSSNTAYFQDMSVWSGDSAGWKHVSMKLPGMQGTTVQLRPDYTQDQFGLCSDVRPGHACGVMIDNIVMRGIVSTKAPFFSVFAPIVLR